MSSPNTASQPELWLQEGLALHRQGRLAEAKLIYERVLQQDPGNFNALNLLGAIALDSRAFENAADLIRRAIAVNPNAEAAHNNLGLALINLRRPQEALASFDTAIARRPAFALAHGNRGNALLDLKRYDDAIASYEKAVAIDPNRAEFWSGNGNALLALGRSDAALHSYDKALALNPALLETHINRGGALLDLKRNADALASYDQAIALRPDYAEAHYNRGQALTSLARWVEALASYDRALSQRPHYPEAYINRGNALKELRRLDDARASYAKAAELDPNNADAHYNLGVVLLDQGDAGASLAHYERAIALRPDFADAYGNLIFTLNFLPGETTASQQARRSAWNERFAAHLAPAAPPQPRAQASGKLRVGYVSKLFAHHASTYACAAGILHHDRSRFEAFCYSDTAPEDDATTLLKAAATVWRSTAALNDEQLAAQIRADSIDILVDCVGHMKAHRLLTFARKPAPIQVTGWGEPTGTGLVTMDYLVADPVLVPPAERALLQEKVVDLPCYLSYWCPDTLPSPGTLPAIASNRITFGSFNRPSKLTAPTLELWSQVLAAVPTSRLLLKSATWVEPAERERLLRHVAKHGIGEDRIAFIGGTTRLDHFVAYTSVDICLDPLPHSGGMTTMDALWMGLPVITLPGATPSSRLSASILTALDLTEWIARDADDYVAKAAAWAADLPRLSAYRRDLRTRIQSSPVGDLARYAAALEARYLEMWAAQTNG